MFTKLYSLLIMSGLLFPHSTSVVTWELNKITEDVNGMAKYNWLQAVWNILVEAIEETKEKIHVKKNLQIHGFTMIHQV